MTTNDEHARPHIIQRSDTFATLEKVRRRWHEAVIIDTVENRVVAP